MCNLPSALYKFRSLTSEQEFNWAIEILATGKFWCPKFYEMNDPMEGVFRIDPKLFEKWDQLDEVLRPVFNQKSRHKICSFSGEEGFHNPAMWGYYAGGFQGIAFKIENIPNDMHKIKYVRSAKTLVSRSSSQVEDILTTKLNPWKHEAEYRFLIDDDQNKHKIGDIKAIYFGNPYGNTYNKALPYGCNKKFKKYFERCHVLYKIAQNKKHNFIPCDGKSIPCYLVKVEDSKVVKDEKSISEFFDEKNMRRDCDEENSTLLCVSISNYAVSIRYSAPKKGKCELTTLDISEQALYSEDVVPGTGTFEWSVLQSGVYIIRLVAGDLQLAQKMVCVK